MPIESNTEDQIFEETLCVRTYFTHLYLGSKGNEFDHVIRKDQLEEHISTLQAAIDAEKLRAEGRESELETKISIDITSAVNELVDLAPGSLDTLNEIAAALGDDSNLAANLNLQLTNITNQQSADKLELESKIAEEKTRAENAETTLENSLISGINIRISDINTLRTDFEAADMSLCMDIKTEKTRAESAELDIESDLNTEKSQRILNDSTLRLDMEASDTQIQSNIELESIRAISAETAISDDLDLEEITRITAISNLRDEFRDNDSILVNSINNEISRALSEESSIMSQITTESSIRATVDTAHESRMTQEELSRQTSDQNLQNQIDTERNRALSVELGLQTNLDNERDTRHQEISRVESVASQTRLDLLQALSDESSARIAKDNLLDNNILTETTERVSDINDLTNDKLDRVAGVGEGLHNFEQVKVRGVEDGIDRVYLTLGKWRVATSVEYDLLFQYNENTLEEPSWKTAVPFIVCPLFQQSSSVATEFGEANDELDSILLGDYTQRTHFDTKSDDSGATFRRHIASNLAGDILVVGGPYQDNTSEDRGEAYIFTYDSVTNTWSSVELLPSSTDSARFGYSVDINDDGNRVVIGAPHHDIRKGRAYIFDYDGSDWTETSILESDPITIGDNLSYRVSMSGDGNRIAASAVGYDITGDGSFNSLNDVGATYVFDYDGSIWSQTAKLLTNDPTHNEVVGTEMKMSKDGSTIIAGSYYSLVDNTPFAGAAYVFKENSGVWSQSTKLYDSTPRPLDFYSFTADISRDGNRVVVGVFGDDLTEITGHPGTSSDYGSLFIYNYDGNSWIEEDKIDASDKFDYTRLQFGGSVSINDSGNILAVGAIVVDGDPYYNGGSYIYKKIDGVWTEKQKIVTDTPDKGDYHTFFSYDLAFNGPGDKLFITAIMHDNPTTFDRIYFYQN